MLLGSPKKLFLGLKRVPTWSQKSRSGGGAGAAGGSLGPFRRPRGGRSPPGGLLGGSLVPFWRHVTSILPHVLAVVLLHQVRLCFFRSTVMLAFFLRFWALAPWQLGFSSEVLSFSSEVSGFSSAVLGFSSGVSTFGSDICFRSAVLGFSSVAPGL